MNCVMYSVTFRVMQMYKDKKYEPATYNKKITNYESKIKKYEVKNYDTIKQYDTIRNYDKIRTYDKITPYAGYKEYVPPWSRDKEPYVRKPAKQPEPKPQKKPIGETVETPPVVCICYAYSVGIVHLE